MTQDPFNDYKAAYAKGIEDAIDINRQALETMVAGAAIASKAYGELAANWIELTRKQVEDGCACAKDVLASTSPQQAADIQTGYAKSAYEQSVKAGAKLTEISFKSANEILAPLGQRLNENIERFWKAKNAA